MPDVHHAMRQPSLPLTCQRWHAGRARYRPAGEVFDPRRAGVEEIDGEAARAFIERHHYSASYPAARFRFGLFQARELVGVAVFSVPQSQGIIPHWFDLAPDQGVELGRLVLLDSVASNGESWFTARAFKALRGKVRGILSYSDPVERRDHAGRVVKRGHVGTVYQALNASYRGRSRSGVLILSRDGRSVSPRALSKLRNDETGAAYAYDQLRALGAPARIAGESGAAYVARALDLGGFRQQRHPGNHVYTWRLDGVREGWPQIAYPRA